jgi:hypothetical protein
MFDDLASVVFTKQVGQGNKTFKIFFESGKRSVQNTIAIRRNSLVLGREEGRREGRRKSEKGGGVRKDFDGGTGSFENGR